MANLNLSHKKGAITMGTASAVDDENQEVKRDWAKICQIVASIVLALAALFWISQGIVTKDDLIPIRNEIQSLRDDVKSVREDITYIRNNMVTKSDIQQIQADIAQAKQNHVDHLTYQHGAAKP